MVHLDFGQGTGSHRAESGHVHPQRGELIDKGGNDPRLFFVAMLQPHNLGLQQIDLSGEGGILRAQPLFAPRRTASHCGVGIGQWPGGPRQRLDHGNEDEHDSGQGSEEADAQHQLQRHHGSAAALQQIKEAIKLPG